jgi:uncharacterized alpha-E superfamily protein
MIARVADSVLWLQRYMERMENAARVLAIAEGGGLDGELPPAQRWTPLLIIAGEYPRFVERFGQDAVRRSDVVLEYLTWDRACPVSLVTSLDCARENARRTREAISRETWEVLNSTWLWMQSDDARALWTDDSVGFYRRLRDAGHLFRGAVVGTMPEQEPFWYMTLGMYLERADQTARLLDVQHHALGPVTHDKTDSAADMVTWVQILLACGAYESFFKRNRGTVRGYRVARFLLFDPVLPRSVVHCLSHARDALFALQQLGAEAGDPVEALHPALDAVEGLLLPLQCTTIEALAEEGIHEALTRIINGLADLSGVIRSTLLAVPGPA